MRRPLRCAAPRTARRWPRRRRDGPCRPPSASARAPRGARGRPGLHRPGHRARRLHLWFRLRGGQRRRRPRPRLGRHPPQPPPDRALRQPAGGLRVSATIPPARRLRRRRRRRRQQSRWQGRSRYLWCAHRQQRWGRGRRCRRRGQRRLRRKQGWGRRRGKPRGSAVGLLEPVNARAAAAARPRRRLLPLVRLHQRIVRRRGARLPRRPARLPALVRGVDVRAADVLRRAASRGHWRAPRRLAE
mmetsp:Transcript_17646/g.58379  ORF Transcript_17646/g.58379 Transcript_17646/m.58379 type:complete len:244 (+) Transcript_17646:293-1024(+)